MALAPPSVDPANEDTMLGLLKEVIRKYVQQNLDDMLPARVIAFDRATNRVQVQPLIQVRTTLGQNVTRGQVASVPVFQIGGGGFLLNFPIKPGDIGWIKASDRDISLFMQNYEESAPNTYRLHSFEDGLFFPNVLNNFSIADEDAANVVLQTADGSVRVAIWEDKVKVTGPQVVLDSPDTLVTGNLRVNGNISAGDDGGGDVVINGNVTLNGRMDATVEVTAAGIPLSTHHHGGVQTGGGNTGGPAA